MQRADAAKRRSLTRQAIVARALEVGAAEGLEAVSIRRLASDLGVTPMALYRHVRDKQDLVNAMTEVVLDGLDLTIGFKPSMQWTDKVRRALLNYRDQIQDRPLALPLSIAYSGEGPPSFWRMYEDLLGIALEAGFKRREAIVLIRVMSILVTGYLLLILQGGPNTVDLDPQERELLRRRVELVQLSLPRDQFPILVESAQEVTDVQLSDPDSWWRETVDLLVFGMERMLERSQARSSGRGRRSDGR